MTALENNRKAFEPLRLRYATEIYKAGGLKARANRERRVIFKELNRLYSATESIKNELRRRGCDYQINISDEEFPNAAYTRYARTWDAAKAAEAASKSGCLVVITALSASGLLLILFIL